MNRLSKLKETLLLGPGPSTVSPSVYDALSTTTIGHLDPRFIEIMDDIKQLLRVEYKTTNDFCKMYQNHRKFQKMQKAIQKTIQ